MIKQTKDKVSQIWPRIMDSHIEKLQIIEFDTS
jgi:hypothetical protein